MPIDISQFKNGGLIKPLHWKDYRLERAPGAGPLPAQYSIRQMVGKIKNQDGSLSCVSQATSYYAEVLNFIETKEKISLSPRFLYYKVFQSGGGSYVKDNMQRIVNMGIAPESEVPSYDHSQPPSENFMEQGNDVTSQIESDAKTYITKSYLTWDNTSVGLYKQAIMQGSGCVVISWGNNYCWQSAHIQMPSYSQQMSWRHGIYLTGWNDATNEFEFVNSWGDNWGESGFGYLPYKYVTSGYICNPWTMIDLPNGTYVSLLSTLKNLIEKVAKLLQLLKLKK